MPVITLTTDFGTTDAYAGAMKGVILGIAPHATIVDISHGVPPRDVLAGALLLEAAADHFPEGTIHVAVVDPGVGSDRDQIAIRTTRSYLVGPDNGLFTLILAQQPLLEAVRLTNPDYHRHPVSDTFHGRDIFAPVAAHLANGTPITQLGEPHTMPVLLSFPQPTATPDGLELHVVHVDHFGNLITDLSRERFEQWCRELGHSDDQPIAIQIGSHAIEKISRTFSDATPGELLTYFGSSNRLEIAVRNSNAAHTLHAHVGTTVHLRRHTGQGR